MREAALEAVKMDENVATWTNLCRTTVASKTNETEAYDWQSKFNSQKQVSLGLALATEWFITCESAWKVYARK